MNHYLTKGIKIGANSAPSGQLGFNSHFLRSSSIATALAMMNRCTFTPQTPAC